MWPAAAAPRGQAALSVPNKAVLAERLCLLWGFFAEFTPLLLLHLWAVRAVCYEGRSQGSAGLSHAVVTAWLWPQAAQGGLGPSGRGSPGEFDWVGWGGKASILHFPF